MWCGAAEIGLRCSTENRGRLEVRHLAAAEAISHSFGESSEIDAGRDEAHDSCRDDSPADQFRLQSHTSPHIQRDQAVVPVRRDRIVMYSAGSRSRCRVDWLQTQYILYQMKE